jgi:hypothetical protein
MNIWMHIYRVVRLSYATNHNIYWWITGGALGSIKNGILTILIIVSALIALHHTNDSDAGNPAI